LLGDRTLILAQRGEKLDLLYREGLVFSVLLPKLEVFQGKEGREKRGDSGFFNKRTDSR
jgi:hypothetical protein